MNTLKELEEEAIKNFSDWQDTWEGQRFEKGSLREANLKDFLLQQIRKAYEAGRDIGRDEGILYLANEIKAFLISFGNNMRIKYRPIIYISAIKGFLKLRKKW